MLSIDRLRLIIPTNSADRAHAVARLVAAGLAALPFTGEHSFDRLEVRPVTVTGDSSERNLAASIAQAIHGALTRRVG